MSRWILLIMCAVSIASLAEEAGVGMNKCDDLSGQYSFFGEWERLEIEGGNPEAVEAYKRANERPRFDFHALSVGANQIIKPKLAVVRRNFSKGIVVDIHGEGINAMNEGFSVKLPAEIELQCRWRLDRRSEGGGENVRSTTNTTIFLRKDASGNLVAEGRKETLIGWVFKKRSLEQWIGRFRQVEK